jgi:hypothetical protein
MTRKDYKLIAGALHRSASGFLTPAERNEADHHPEHDRQWHKSVDEIAAALAADNPRFDHAKFIEACETGKGAA